MKTVMVSTPPQCVCKKIASDEPNWGDRLVQIIKERTPIRLDTTEITAILDSEHDLDAAGYEHQILRSDCRQQFLIPSAHWRTGTSD